MSKSNNIQPGHYRTYRESGKTISVNGGPKHQHSSVTHTPLSLAIGVFIFIVSMWWLHTQIYGGKQRSEAEVQRMMVEWEKGNK